MDLSALGRRIGRSAHRASGPLTAVVTAPPIAAAGFAIATKAALVWGRMLGGTVTRHGELTVVSGLPAWAFGRGGTTVGATFLTNDALSEPILAHEDVHRQQWQRWGLVFIPLYFAAGIEGTRNRFEIEAGLKRGGYLK